MLKVGKLEPVNIRELWKHEERGFSAWLEENLDRLSEVLGISLSDPQCEVLAGNFQCDLVATNLNGDRVIIENQLEGTNHDHLGKLLTYVSNLQAKAAVWIATSHRPEHVTSIQWLNENSPQDVAFYMVKLAAYRMSGSEIAAPLFTVIVGPNAETKNFGRQKKELAERHLLRLRFWEGLLSLARKSNVLWHAQLSPGKAAWLGAGAGVQSGVAFTYLIWMDSSAVEFYIDTVDETRNTTIFIALEAQKDAIEKEFGAPLIWDEMRGKRARRIRFVLDGGGLQNEQEWPQIQAKMVPAMDRLAKAIKAHLG